MWQFLWGICIILLGFMLMFKTEGQPIKRWERLPTLTSTQSEVSAHLLRKLPTPIPGGLLAERPQRLPTLTPTPRANRLPTLTPTPLPAVDTVGHVVAEWPIEVSSNPIQPAVPPVPPAQLPANLPVNLPKQSSPPVIPPSTPAAEPAVYSALIPTPTLESDSIPVPVGPLIGLPVKGRISQNFGCSPYYTGIAGPGCPGDKPWFHDALDIAVEADTPVAAMMTGKVIFAGADTNGPKCQDNGGKEERGYGWAVVVDNGAGWRTLYAHLSKPEVSAGQTVTPETVVGATGESGCVTGPHLHFGVQYQGSLVDPYEVIPGLAAPGP